MRVLVWLVVLTGVSLAQSPSPVDPLALQRMVATERAFAAATAELGVRDGFLTFFADDAIEIVRGTSGSAVSVRPARASLVARPLPPLPLAGRLVWEPFTGHVSGDGTLGWLTGGFAMPAQPSNRLDGQGAYFSVWTRQSDGTWRVWLDEGISLPALWRDASPFRVAPEPDAGRAGNPGEPVAAAEQAVRSGGPAWVDRLAADVRLHRDGLMPLVGRAAVRDWAAERWQTITHTVVTGVDAASGDLAVALGGYDAVTAAGPEHGTWIRVWKRDVTGRWRIVFETSRRTP